jgi:hypothetical protein
MRPDECGVDLISVSRRWRYKQHDTPFLAVVDGALVENTPFKSYVVRHDGPDTIEPLVSIWSFHTIVALSRGQHVMFNLEGESIPLPEGTLRPLVDLVEYFNE